MNSQQISMKCAAFDINEEIQISYDIGRLITSQREIHAEGLVLYNAYVLQGLKLKDLSVWIGSVLDDYTALATCFGMVAASDRGVKALLCQGSKKDLGANSSTSVTLNFDIQAPSSGILVVIKISEAAWGTLPHEA